MTELKLVALVVMIVGMVLTIVSRPRPVPASAEDGGTPIVWPSIGLAVTGLGTLMVAVTMLLDADASMFSRVLAVIILLILVATAVFVEVKRRRR